MNALHPSAKLHSVSALIGCLAGLSRSRTNNGEATPSGEPAVPSPVNVESCATALTPLLAKSTIETDVYGKLPFTDPVNLDAKLTLAIPIFVLGVNTTSSLNESPYEKGLGCPL
jgi:hypothetical protein